MVNNEIQKKDELSECICALYDDQIYKFKITTNPQDIDYLIEEYINGLDIYIFESTDANSLDNNEKELVEKFFPYLGKFRLEGKLKSTHNYFYPIGGSEMVNTLFSMYKTNILKESNFKYMEKLYSFSKDSSILNFIKKIFSVANIELTGEITVDELNNHLNYLERFFSDIRLSYTYDTYISMKNLLESSKKNRERINNLGLNDYFVEAIKIKNEKDNQSVKTKKHN